MQALESGDRQTGRSPSLVDRHLPFHWLPRRQFIVDVVVAEISLLTGLINKLAASDSIFVLTMASMYSNNNNNDNDIDNDNN